MAQATITTDRYKLFPSPRNVHRVVFEHEVFVPHPYALIDLATLGLKGLAPACSPRIASRMARTGSW